MQLQMTGARVARVRCMTDEERTLEGWESVPGDIVVGEYDNGAVLYPGACDSCGQPGKVWALYGGTRWEIEPHGEDHVQPEPPRPPLPRWAAFALATSAVTSIVSLCLLGMCGVVDVSTAGAVPAIVLNIH